MVRVLIRRVLGMIPALLLVIILLILLIHFIPGDPIDAILGEHATVADREALRVALGLNMPLHLQIWTFITGILHGNWGTSLVSGKPVWVLFAERIPPTIILALAAMGWAVTIGGTLGLIMAAGTKLSRKLIDILTISFFATPSFVVGPLLIVAISVGLGWLPVSGNDQPGALILPSLTLGLGLGGVLARMLAVSLRRALSQPFVTSVKAKGGTPTRYISIHALPNALLPVVQIFFLQLGMVLTGTVLTEAVFGWPGLGSLLVEALHQRDYPVIQSCLLLISLTYMAALLVADLISTWLDPRVRN